MSRMIVCTSTSCIDYLGKPDNVAILPINIHINQETYIDGKDITITELFRRMVNQPNARIRTTAPHEGQLIEFFYDLIDKGVDEILVITLSASASKTYENIRSIQSIFGEKLKIHLFDSRIISHGEAILTSEASKMLAEGKDIFDIILRLNKMRDKMQLYITVDDLKPMIQAKRISGVAGFFANLFDIKPVIYMQHNGDVVGHEKVRGFDKSLYRLVELVAQEGRGKLGNYYTASAPDNPYLSLLNQTLKHFGLQGTPHLTLASATLANIGPHSIGMMFVEDPVPRFPAAVSDARSYFA